jgi:SAM-dependent methyltransferase
MHVLDVGAGPLTIVGKCFRGTRILLSAVDPLAQHYDRLLEKYGLIPPVRTLFGKAEDVAAQFPNDGFDLVHARNCLDHGIDPFHAVSQMLTLAKPGGFVYLKHHPNEGLNEQWHGLHQWNFSMSGSGDFIISSRDREVNVTSEFADRADVHCEMRTEAGEEWLIVQIHKQ